MIYFNSISHCYGNYMLTYDTICILLKQKIYTLIYIGGNMKTFPKREMLTIFLTLIWCILNENFNIATILSGVFVSFVTFYILKLIQPESGKTYSYNISILKLFIFMLFVFKDIYLSAFKAIKHILKNEINPQFVATSTKIKKPWLQALIGNAITLTPGTTTVHMADGNYTILWLYPLTIRQKDIKKHLITGFEKLLIEEEENA